MWALALIAAFIGCITSSVGLQPQGCDSSSGRNASMKRTDALHSASPSSPLTSSTLGESAELDLPALWDAYRVSRDESFRNRLLIHSLPLSRVIARHMHTRMSAAVEFDDLAQAAILGVRSAI